MNVTIAYFFGALVGIVTTIVITRPLKSWRDGYNTAKEHYSDWKKGFNDGWYAAFWQIEKIAREWKNIEWNDIEDAPTVIEAEGTDEGSN